MKPSLSIRGRAREDIAEAFAAIAAAQSAASQTGVDPLTALRDYVDHYGEVGLPLPVADVEIRPVSAGGVPAEWVVPEGAGTAHRLIYLHGGGWAAGGVQSHRAIAAALALRTGHALLLVEYRLAPEHPFPAGLDDCHTALAWVAKCGPEGEAPVESLHLVGDSAGANLAVAACRKALLEGIRSPDRLVLISPVLDCSVNPARGEGAYADVGPADLAAGAGLYLGGRVEIDHPAASPLYCEDEVLAAMPPTLLQASAHEYLLWDSQEFARRLAAAGARAVLSVWPDMPHVWHAFLTLLPEAGHALDEIADFLRR